MTVSISDRIKRSSRFAEVVLDGTDDAASLTEQLKAEAELALDGDEYELFCDELDKLVNTTGESSVSPGVLTEAYSAVKESSAPRRRRAKKDAGSDNGTASNVRSFGSTGTEG